MKVTTQDSQYLLIQRGNVKRDNQVRTAEAVDPMQAVTRCFKSSKY